MNFLGIISLGIGEEDLYIAYNSPVTILKMCLHCALTVGDINFSKFAFVLFNSLLEFVIINKQQKISGQCKNGKMRFNGNGRLFIIISIPHLTIKL